MFEEYIRAVEQEEQLRDARERLAECEAEREEEAERKRQAAEQLSWLGKQGLHLFIGPRLWESSRAWFQQLKRARYPKDLISDESADLLTALARRLLRVGSFGLVVGAFAVLTPVATLWQTLVLRQQVHQQASDTLIVRRAQLVATIYEEDCEDTQSAVEGRGSTERCAPRSHLRARQQAVLAFVELERSAGVDRPDLREADLAGMNLFSADLRGIFLASADLSRANLFKTNLGGALLNRANLRGTTLQDSILGNVDLSATDLGDADLRGADLRGADLQRANLRRADFRGACVDPIRVADATLAGEDARNYLRKQGGIVEPNRPWFARSNACQSGHDRMSSFR